MARNRRRMQRRRTGRRQRPVSRQQVIFQQRGTIGQANSAGVSIVSLTGSKQVSTLTPLKAKIQIASTGKSFYQLQFFTGTTINDNLNNVTGLIAEGIKTHYFRWPKRTNGITENEGTQNLIEIDHPCMNMNETTDTSLYYHVMLTFQCPKAGLQDTCPAVNGVPRTRIRPQDNLDNICPSPMM